MSFVSGGTRLYFCDLVVTGTDPASFLGGWTVAKKKAKKKISITAKRIESLLYDFLEELLFLMDTDSFMINSLI